MRHTGLLLVALLTLPASVAAAATRHVAVTGADPSNDCTQESTPCRTIRHGIQTMAAGDTLIIGDGTYTDPITDMPSGSADAYTTVRAANDWGVVIDGSAWPDTFKNGITVASKSYVVVRGVKVRMNQANGNNQPVMVPYSNHVKIQRCAGSYGPTTGNAATFTIGPTSSYVLVEESYAFGGARYQFIAYQSDHIVVRRSVARSDYWNGSLQCGGFVNYDSFATAWQNDIVLDSDTAHCSGHLYGGFWNENKPDAAPDTSQTLTGNIILNVQAFFAGDLDWAVSGTRTINDTVIWGSSGGYYGDQGIGAAATVNANRMTIGAISGKYDGPNGQAASGTGFSIYGSVANTLTNSLLASCASYGVADYTSSDYNAFSRNGANYGGKRVPATGAHDHSSQNGNEIDALAGSLRYLPRIEPGSALKTAGQAGGQVGAEIVSKTGVSGTLHGEPGWDTTTSELLWPFPNEAQIRADMAAYSGPGAAGARGFATGNSLDGTPQTLTKYVWEYLGNQIPDDIYGFHIAIASLPRGVVGAPYSASVTCGGGTGPYRWSLAGALPPGLALDASTGVIAGTPTVAGTTTLTISATDSSTPNATATKALSLVIEAPGAGGGGSGAGGDAGTQAGASASASEDGGCSCRIGAPRGSAGILAFGAVVAFALARRRRSRG